MRSAKAVFFLTVCVLFATLVCAQTGTSSLRGIVSDPKGAVLPGATVTISDKQNGFSRSATTDGRGEYQFLQLPPSTYTVAVNGKGFAEVRQEGVQLLVGVPTTLNVSLQVQGQTITVEVTGEATHVNTTDATMGNAFEAKQIVELPFEGRNPVEILSLQAGVTYTSPTSGTAIDNMFDSRSGATNGGRSDQTNITLDGVDNNDQSNGFAFQGAVRSTLDSVEEFRVTTSNSNADAGRSSGAQVQLVTKSGTNGFHGVAEILNRSNIGEGNDWFNEQGQLNSGLQNIPPYLRRNTYGASLGGPIKKDRAFFYLGWERLVQHESTQTTRVVPSLNLRNGIVSYLCDVGDPNCVVGNTGGGGAAGGLTVTTAPGAGSDAVPAGDHDCADAGASGSQLHWTRYLPAGARSKSATSRGSSTPIPHRIRTPQWVPTASTTKAILLRARPRSRSILTLQKSITTLRKTETIVCSCAEL